MTRIDRARYDSADFKIEVDVPTRFGDVDPLRHINNVAVVALLQEGRVAFNASADTWSAAGTVPFVAAISVEYAGELHYPEPVRVATAVLRVGRTSVTLAQRLRQKGMSAVYAEVTLVLTCEGRPVPLPAETAARFAQYGLDDAAA